MPAFLIARVEVTEPGAYEKYKQLAASAIEKHGGRYLARGGRTLTLEGEEESRRVVIVEFESLKRAEEFYHSSEYREAMAARRGAAVGQFVVVEGL
ncbi:MAG TPA: DUF1330 domain-containing protein [Vicinamibacteria bacterium]|nr:DUF1330 domain-containing protein [Vicinamibacteria bacterium]